MYVNPNFKTKKDLKEAISKGERVEIFSPGPFPAKENGEEFVEGPHYPARYSWYSRVMVEDGRVVAVLD